MKVSVKIVNKSHHALPSYSTLFSAGMDIRANLSEPTSYNSYKKALVSLPTRKTGANDCTCSRCMVYF